MGRRLGNGVAFLLWTLAAQGNLGCGSSGPSGMTAAGGRGADAAVDTSSSAGGAGGNPTGAGGMGGGAGGAGGAGMGGAGGVSCSDLFAPTLQTYSVDISDTDWNAIQAEFMSAGMLIEQAFFNYQPKYYPVVFHFGNDASKNAYIRLKGDSSWREAVLYDGANGKMQFVVAFDQIDSLATFHGVGKIGFDMPRSDLSFLHDRIANTWMRHVGIAALCATSGRLMVNGNYYGLYVAEERLGHRVLQEFFPGNADNDLFKGGATPSSPGATDWNKLSQFWSATTPAALAANVDLPQSFLTWAAEMMLNDGDGYWGGDHNFMLYDEGSGKPYVFLPTDLDSTLDFLGYFTGDPVWWWSSRPGLQFIGQHYRTAMNDATLRTQYASAVATQFGRYDASQLQGWLDQWSAQIRDAVAADPHKPSSTTLAVFDTAVALARQGMQARADFVSKWLACQQSGSGADQDGDGYIWCKDCDDTSATTHPGAPEICGNQIDDNCNGLYDDGCPTTGGADGGVTATARDGGTD
jgi:CotH kinase protein/Putative metal-binding motif